jgi:GNAT superfamily N-acetyltransferase
MDRRAVLAAFDEQIRRHPPAEGERIERDDAVVRVVSDEDGWSMVTWSALTQKNADSVIAATIERFAALGVGAWEWKHYSYDRPADLPQRLLAAGFTAEPPETLMVAEIAELALDVPPPAGVELLPVEDTPRVEMLVRVHDEVFGEDHSALGRELVARLARRPPTVAAVVAMAGDSAIGAGRVEFHTGTEFASLWGDGTVPEWRGRGVFRSLVAHRAALASARGFRYLSADAMPASRPIFQRLGFVELATTTPFKHPGGHGGAHHRPA